MGINGDGDFGIFYIIPINPPVSSPPPPEGGEEGGDEGGEEGGRREGRREGMEGGSGRREDVEELTYYLNSTQHAVVRCA